MTSNDLKNMDIVIIVPKSIFTLFNIFFIIIVFGIRHFLVWKYTNSEYEIAQKWIILLCFTEGLSALKVSFLLGA